MSSPTPWRREKTGIYHAEGGHPIFVSVDLLPLSDQHDNLDAAVAAVNERDDLREALKLGIPLVELYAERLESSVRDILVGWAHGARALLVQQPAEGEADDKEART